MGGGQTALHAEQADPGHPGLAKILLITRKLGGGGAQRQLIEIARNIDRSRFSVTIVAMYPGGLLAEEAASIPGVKVISLDKKSRYDFFGSTKRFLSLCKSRDIDLIWSFSGGMEYGFAAKLFQRRRLVIGIRHAGLDKSNHPTMQAIMFRIESIMARLADMMVANSEAGRDFFAAHGFPVKKILVTPNGYSTTRFNRFPELRAALRLEWGYSDDTILIGMVGRIDPLKDHSNFFGAAAILGPTNPKLRFVCVGEGSKEYTHRMHALSEELGVDKIMFWAGTSANMPAVYNALDILVLCSTHEGTPNVVGEAMACCTPCVVTNVGDAAKVLNDIARTVPAQDTTKLARAIEDVAGLSKEKRLELGMRDRKHIEANYSLELLARRTETILSGIVGGEPFGDIAHNLASVGIAGN